jgi:hypothetical protein
LALYQTGRRTGWQMKHLGRLLKLTVTERLAGTVSREWSLGDARCGSGWDACCDMCIPGWAKRTGML